MVERTSEHSGPEELWMRGLVGTEDQWVQSTRGTVRTKDQWVQRTRGRVVPEDRRNNGPRGLEDQRTVRILFNVFFLSVTSIKG